jgi:hypothetical protein
MENTSEPDKGYPVIAKVPLDNKWNAGIYLLYQHYTKGNLNYQEISYRFSGRGVDSQPTIIRSQVKKSCLSVNAVSLLGLSRQTHFPSFPPTQVKLTLRGEYPCRHQASTGAEIPQSNPGALHDD